MSGHFIYMFNQYFDSNGDPLAGGKLNFYAANTAYATRKDTYSDSAQTSANANPVILDAEGRSGPIYGGSGLYDVRITDSDDVLIETKDDIYVGTNPTGTTFAVVDTYAELTALSAGQYDIVYARGNASVNDGGGRFFNWDADSSASDNSETILEPDSSPTTGRWIARRWDNLLGGDNAASTEIGADIAVDTGGNLKLYAAGHSSKAGDWELRDGSTLVLSYDKSDGSASFPNHNVGIGTATPSTLLHLRATSPELRIEMDNTETSGKISFFEDVAGEHARITSTGSQLIIATADVGASIQFRSDNFATNLVLSGAAGSEVAEFRGSVGIETNSPDPAALLDIVSTTKGFLPPRMTTTQRDAISTPPAGLVIYNTSTNVLNFYNGSSWGAV